MYDEITPKFGLRGFFMLLDEIYREPQITNLTQQQILKSIQIKVIRYSNSITYQGFTFHPFQV